MGLDMYLTKRTYVGANFAHNNVNGVIQLTRGEENTPIPVNLNRVTYIIENVGYWRKANHIHQWFVKNVQDGRDECQESYVEKEKLEQLLADCKTVLVNRELAAETLPRQEGFFFGNTDYNDWYFSDCEKTVQIIGDLLKEDLSESDIYYEASW